MSFFNSELGIAIAWICGVASFIYSLFQRNANIRLRAELHQTQNQVVNLQNSLNKTKVDVSKNEVTQNGEKNVHTGRNSGGMTINM